MIEAILFDCDGVIADSEAHWNEIDAEHLDFHGIPDYKGQHKEHVLGKSFALSSSFYKERFALAPSVEELVEHRTNVAAKFYGEKIPLFDGVSEVLASLKGDGLKLALATSSVGLLIHPFLQRHNIARFFDAVVTGDLVKNGKPHPDIYLLAAQKVGAPTQNSLVVEDALAGLQAGRAAHCPTVAIPDPRWMDLALFADKSDYSLENIRQLPALVRALREKVGQVG